jgi:hypothetical protein
LAQVVYIFHPFALPLLFALPLAFAIPLAFALPLAFVKRIKVFVSFLKSKAHLFMNSRS